MLLRIENALLNHIIKFKLINISRLGCKVAHIRVEWLEFYIYQKTAKKALVLRCQESETWRWSWMKKVSNAMAKFHTTNELKRTRALSLLMNVNSTSSESTHRLNLTFENRFFWHSLLREALVCWTIDRVLVLLFLYLLCRRANDLIFFGLVRQCRLPTLDCRHANSHCFGHNLAVSLFLAQFSRKIENESWYGRFVVLN